MVWDAVDEQRPKPFALDEEEACHIPIIGLQYSMRPCES